MLLRLLRAGKQRLSSPPMCQPRLFLAAAALVASQLSLAPCAAALFQAGATRAPPVMISAAAPERQALVIVPDFSSGGGIPRGAVAQSDAAAYRELLRLLGFSVTVIAVDTRPTLDLESRNFAKGVTRDGEVAVFVLGAVIAAGGKLWVPAADLPAGARTPERIATESLDLAEILRRIQEHGPRELVAIVDECGSGAPQPACPLDQGALPEGASVILAKRVAPRNDGMPQAGIASLRDELVPLMQEPDLAFIRLFERLKGELADTNATIVASPALSRGFTFLPGGFFAKLPTTCNKVDGGASAGALQAAPSVAPLATACERAAQTWAFTSYFRDRLAIAREQAAFQKAMTGCDDIGADAYLNSYPNGAYRFPVNDHKSECARRREQPPAAAPVPLAPPPAAEEPSLHQRAYDAVVEYYHKHDYAAGTDLSSLATIYPSVFDRHGTPVARIAHLRELAQFYAPYASFTFNVLSSTLDYRDCSEASFCLVRGMAQRTSRKLSDQATGSGRLRFSLRFDLTRGTRVLSECAMVEGRASRETPCD